MMSTDLRLNLKMLMWITIMTFNKIYSAHTHDVNQTNPLITADVGDNVILHCFRLREETGGAIVWYKQKLGHEPRVMVTVQQESIYEDEFKSPRFSIEKEKGSWHLKIAHVEPSDEAMYYCGFRNFLTTFGKGSFLYVKGKPDLRVSVFQSGGLDSVPAGASVTLQCLVLSESRAAELQVLWFRAAPPQSHPQIIYTHHNSSHQCESGSSTHTCVYNFSKNILSLSDTGTYYCAVAACGKIIFGNGTQVQLEEHVDPVVICLSIALGVCVVVITVQAFISCKWRNCQQHTQKQKTKRGQEKTSSQVPVDSMELNYAALHFKKNQTKTERQKRKQPQDTVYSDIDISIIEVMTDEELGQYIVRYGDRLALRAFCRQRTVANKMSAEATVKFGLMQKVRDRLGEQRKTFSSDKGHGAGNKYAAKDTRRVEIGWLYFHNGTYCIIRSEQKMEVAHSTYLFRKQRLWVIYWRLAKACFFPNGQSAKGSVEDFEFDIRDFSHNPVSPEATVSQLYEQSKLRLLRIYTSSQAKNVSLILSDSSSDFKSADKRPMKVNLGWRGIPSRVLK
ncbi:uncharacterized protein Hap1MRO34_012573 [Clarias gariepinus]